jgi:TP901 family phage tail tape measure protein
MSDILSQVYELKTELGGLSELNRLLKEHNATIKDIRKATVAYNADGNKSAAILEAVSKAGQKVTVTIKGIAESEVEYSVKVGETSTRVKELVAQLNSLKLKHAEVDKAKVRAILSGKSELEQQRQLGALLDSTIKKEERLAEAIRNREERTRLANLAEARSRQGVANAFTNKIIADAGTTSLPLSGASVVAANQQLTSLNQTIAKTKVSYAQLQQIQTQLAAGNFSKIAPNLQPVAAQIQQTIALMNQLGYAGPAAWAKIGNAGQQAAQSTLLSWKNFERFFITHIAYTLFFQLVQGMKAGIKEAIELQKRLSEIRTITQDNQRTPRQYAEQIRQVSSDAGFDIQDVAEGLYETVSNQIATGERAVDFIKQASLFARVTNSSVEDSVNLLSSAINSYSLSALDAEKVSAQLFELINLGRVRASELEGSFGRVAVLASQMGVGLSEAAGALAVLTINGVRYSEAYTQVINLLQSFLRPTKAMAEFISSLGFESGEQLVRIKGFTGAMQLLRKELESGGVARIAELDDNIRGLRGAIGLIGGGDGTAKFEKATKQIAESLQTYKTAVNEIAFESPAAQLEKEWNRLKNVMTIDIGGPALKGLAAFLKVLRQDVTEISLLVPQLGLTPFGAAAGITGLVTREIFFPKEEEAETDNAVKVFAAQVSKLVEEVELNLKGKFKAAAESAADNVRRIQDEITVLKDGLPELGNQLKDAFDKGNKAAKEQLDLLERLAKLSQKLGDKSSDIKTEAKIEKSKSPLATAKILESEVSSAKDRVRSALAAGDVATAEDQLSKIQEITERIGGVRTALVVDHSKTLAEIRTTESEFGSKLAEAADTSARRKIREQFESQISELRRRSDNELYMLRNIGSGAQLAADFFKDSQTVTAEAAAAGLRIKEEIAAEIDKARALIDAFRADSEIKKGKGQTDLPASGDRAITAIQKFDPELFRKNGVVDNAAAQSELNRLLGELKAATYASPAAYADAIKIADGVIARLKNITEKTYNKDVAATFRDSINEMDTASVKLNNLRKSIIEGRADFVSATDLLGKMISKVKEGGGPDADAAITKLQGLFTTIQQIKPADIEAKIPELTDAFTKGIDKLKTSISAEEAINIFGSQAEYQGYIDAFGRAVTAKFTELQSSDALITFIDKLQGAAGVGIVKEAKEDILAIENINPLAKMAQNALVTDKGLMEMYKVHIPAIDAAMPLSKFNILSADSQSVLSNLRETPAALAALDSSITTLKSAIATVGTTYDTIQNGLSTMSGFLTNIMPKSHDGWIDTLKTISSMYRTIASIKLPDFPSFPTGEAASAPSSGPYVNLQNLTGSGPVSRAQDRLDARFAKAGGGRIGTDSVRALLSPGEFVVNSASARQHFQQLMAINSGHRARPMATGGNVTVGDISVNVPNSSGMSTPERAREMATLIKREIQKGSIRL